MEHRERQLAAGRGQQAAWSIEGLRNCGFTTHCAKRPERLDLSSSTGLVEGLAAYRLRFLPECSLFGQFRRFNFPQALKLYSTCSYPFTDRVATRPTFSDQILAILFQHCVYGYLIAAVDLAAVHKQIRPFYRRLDCILGPHHRGSNRYSNPNRAVFSIVTRIFHK